MKTIVDFGIPYTFTAGPLNDETKEDWPLLYGLYQKREHGSQFIFKLGDEVQLFSRFVKQLVRFSSELSDQTKRLRAETETETTKQETIKKLVFDPDGD